MWRVILYVVGALAIFGAGFIAGLITGGKLAGKTAQLYKEQGYTAPYDAP